MQESKKITALRFPSGGRWARYGAAGAVCSVFLAVLLAMGNLLSPAHAADIGNRTRVLGKVEPMPNTVVEIQAPAAGRIISAVATPYTVGDHVKKGDPLAIIENYYNLHDAAHLSRSRWDVLYPMLNARDIALRAKVALEKAERLEKLGTVSGQQVLALKGTSAMAEAEYQKRKALLAQTDAQIQTTQGINLVRKGIFAPISGTINSVYFTQGQIIQEGVVLYRIVNRNQVAFRAQFAEPDFRNWDEKAIARIHFDSLPGKVFVGHPYIISPVVDPQARTRDVIFRVENTGRYLRFGMIGWVDLEAQ